MLGRCLWLVWLLALATCETASDAADQVKTCEAEKTSTPDQGAATSSSPDLQTQQTQATTDQPSANETTADATNATKTWSDDERESKFVPKLDPKGAPVDKRIDPLFNDAVASYTGKAFRWPQYTKVPSWHWAMLNDIQRNSAYRLAISKAIAKQKAKGLETRLLDIGTGTGLLSLLAIKGGADHVSTCEVHTDLIEIARENVRRNCNRTDCPLKIIPKRSTEIEVGPGKEMEKKANILVSEIVDSMLLRESIIPTIMHATENLIEPDAIIIPKGGKLAFMVFESKELRDTHYLDNDVVGLDLSYLNEGCHELNAQDHLPNFLYRAISETVTGLIFDFANVHNHKPYEFFAFNITIISDGVLDGMVMWLDLVLDDKISLSCDPRLGKLHHPHWQHVVFYPKYPVFVRAGDVLTVMAGHGEVSVRAKMVFINGKHFYSYPPYRFREGAFEPPENSTGYHF